MEILQDRVEGNPSRNILYSPSQVRLIPQSSTQTLEKQRGYNMSRFRNPKKQKSY